MTLCYMILSVPWYMFDGIDHTAILSHYLTFITEVVSIIVHPIFCSSNLTRIILRPLSALFFQ